MHRPTMSAFFCSVQNYDSSPQGKSLLIIPPLTDVTRDEIGREGKSLQVKYLTAKAVVNNQPSPSWLSNVTTWQKKRTVFARTSISAQKSASDLKKSQITEVARTGLTPPG